VCGHRVFVDDFADGDTDVVGPGECPGGDAGDDRGERVLGGPQRVLAFAGPLGRQKRVAAGDEPFTGVVGVVSARSCSSTRLSC
jgi:hypothetical protein